MRKRQQQRVGRDEGNLQGDSFQVEGVVVLAVSANGTDDVLVDCEDYEGRIKAVVVH